jgi:SAM-dependent methyltransferase
VLDREQDAYGHLMRDHLRGLRTAEVIERDDGWFGVSTGAPAYFAEYPDWPKPQRSAMRFVRGRVLDVGCGAGRAALHLQRRGHRVVAIDASPLAIETCRRRGVKDARVIPVTRVSRRLGCFDTILLLGNNLGLLANPRRARWLLTRFHRLTSPSGRVVAEATDPYATTDPHHLHYQRWNRRRGRLSGQLRIRVRYTTHRTPWFDYLLVSQAELRALLRGTGWRVARVFEAEGGPYVAILEKTQGRR